LREEMKAPEKKEALQKKEELKTEELKKEKLKKEEEVVAHLMKEEHWMAAGPRCWVLAPASRLALMVTEHLKELGYYLVLPMWAAAVVESPLALRWWVPLRLRGCGCWSWLDRLAQRWSRML
jgi:hypothetical protein